MDLTRAPRRGGLPRLILLRHIFFGGRRSYRELLTESLEGISTHILAARLRSLVAAGILTRAGDPGHRQRGIYSLTEAGIELLPLLVELGAWGRKYLPASRELSVRAEFLERGGAELLQAFQAELRHEHLGLEGPPPPSVRAQLQRAYEEAVGAAPADDVPRC